jgi:uncharacterized protein YbjT (DUF2867 family)
MNITVFGASGGIGTHVVDLAAQRGHQVRAIYRATPQPPPPGQAEILVAPDIFDPAFATTPSAAPTSWSPRSARTSPPGTTPGPR